MFSRHFAVLKFFIIITCFAFFLSPVAAEVHVGVHTAYSMGGDIEESKIGFGSQIEVSFNKNFSLELAMSIFGDEYAEEGISIEHDFITTGLSAIYRIPIAKNVKGYLLGGLNYNIVSGSKVFDRAVYGTNLWATIHPKNDFGCHIGTGLNFPLSNKWNFFTEYRYTFLELDETEIVMTYVGEDFVSEVMESNFNYDFGLLKMGINYIF